MLSMFNRSPHGLLRQVQIQDFPDVIIHFQHECGIRLEYTLGVITIRSFTFHTISTFTK